MYLVNGNLSKGIFVGEIPPQKNNITIQYNVYLEDNLGYFYNSSKEKYSINRDTIAPNISDFYEVGSYCPSFLKESCNIDLFPVVSNDYIFGNLNISDIGSGIKNATFYYHADYSSSGFSANQWFPQNLTLIEGNRYSGIYRTQMPPDGMCCLKANSAMDYSIEAYDYAGNKNIINKTINNSFFTVKENTIDKRYMGEDYKYHSATNTTNNIRLTPTVREIDSKTLTAYVDFSFSGSDIYPPNIGGNVTGIENVDENILKNNYTLEETLAKDYIYNEFIIEMIFDQHFPNSGIEFDTYKAKHASSFSLIGETSEFPFDHYYINLFIKIPIDNLTINPPHPNPQGSEYIARSYDFSPHFDDKIRNLWSPSGHVTKISKESSTAQNFLVNSGCNNTGPRPVEYRERESPCSSVSFANIKLEFHRNYSVAILTIPLIAIFFLLGSIFIFESSSETIGNRLTLTLAIFALIFTLPDIIDALKPETSGPTIADSLLSIIIISSIAFTISSIISSSVTVQKRFRYYTWIDYVAFLFVSIIVISYFTSSSTSSNYSFDVLIWLVPIILFGLGYGLLLRTLGIKITKPIFARRRKKTAITKV
jgi:hypothetical protein